MIKIIKTKFNNSQSIKNKAIDKMKMILNAIKSQAALEFLTTYAWAFVVILTTIAALAYFGILNPSKLLPERCSFGSEIGCTDYVIASNGVQLRLKNNAGNPIIVDAVTVSNEKAELACISSITGNVWDTGEIIDVPVTCIDFTAAAGIVQGNKEKLSIQLKYYDVGSSTAFTKAAQGEVFAVAGNENVSNDYLGGGGGGISGLAAAYSFNENSGSTLTDVSGNGNDGTINGGSGVNKFNNPSLETDGNGDGLADSWGIYPSGACTPSIISEGVSGNAQKMAGCTGSGGIYGVPSYEQNQYHSVEIWLKVESGAVYCADLNRGHIPTIYVTAADNGNQWKKYTASGYVDTNPDCCYHCYATSGTVFYLDEARIEAGWTTGKYGSALYFDGVNDYIDLGSSSTLKPQSSFSVEAWINSNSGGAEDYIVSSVDVAGTLEGFDFSKNSGDKLAWDIFDLVPNSGGGTGAALSAGTWHYASLVYDASANKVYTYLNGAQDSVTSVTGSLDQATLNLLIGRAGSPSLYLWNGAIDSVAIYDRALTPEEIALHANS